MLRIQPWRARRIRSSSLNGLKSSTRATTRRYATGTRLGELPLGGNIHGFTFRRAKAVPELQLTALDFQHDKTGAEYLHIARDDRNNVFSIGFKTNPPDRTGVPHILEHTTLCGSKMYPIRDPFFKMLPRSLSNFMNAFTSSDHTTYPFATTNHQDFKNLMNVYLDATLNPLLEENDFIQEGWRIGPTASREGENGEDSLEFKGVVYNEMKGQMSDASYLFYIRFQEHMFPALNNSGGDPQKMTDLTYSELKNFHRENYRPSNAKIFTYGDIPITTHLSELNGQLTQFDGLGKTGVMIKEPLDLQSGPKVITIYGPVDPMLSPSMQQKTSVSWVTSDSSNVLETFSFGIVSSLLLDGFSSPMYQALIDTGLGTDFSPNTGFDGSAGRGIFSIGLNGVKETEIHKVQGAIQANLEEVCRNGFEAQKVEGLLHQLELALKHKTAGFGMELMQRLEPGWFNGVDPFDALAWNEIVNAFKQRLSEGRYLEGLLDKYLLNERTLTFNMKPSESYSIDLAKEEKARLQSKLAQAEQVSSKEEAFDKFAKQETMLLETQAKHRDQDLGCLPSVHVKDIPRSMERKSTRESAIGEAKVQWREAATNGLTYFRAIKTLEGLSTDLRMLIPLFTAAIMRLGTKDKTTEQLEDLIRLNTGGIGVSYHSAPSPFDFRTSAEGLSFSGYALDRKVPAMLELLRSIVQETNFDGPLAESQIIQLLQQDASGALDAIANAGHGYASRYAQAGMSHQGLLNEQISGLTQLQTVIDLADRASKEGLGDIVSKLKRIQSFSIANTDSFRAAITCGIESTTANEAALVSFLSRLPKSTSIPDSQSPDPSTPYAAKTYFPLPYQVSYSAMSLPTVPYTHPSSAPLQILSQLLTHKHLHHEIREKGGAYGGGASSSSLSGIFNFYSYRDPNPRSALDVMRDSGLWAVNRNWTPQDLEEAKLSTFQGVDAPQSVSDEGMTSFLSGVTEDMEQKKREQLLDVKIDNVKEVAQRFLLDAKNAARIALIGEGNEWAKEEGWAVKEIELAKASEVAHDQ